MRALKNFLAAFLAAALVLVALPAAALVGSWSTPADLSVAGSDANQPQVAVDSAGLAIAVWTRNNGSNSIVQSSTSQSGGAWSTPVDLSELGQDAYRPQVRVDSTGLATAIWMRSNGTNFILQSSKSMSGGAWSTPVNISTAGENADGFELVIDSSRLATVLWYRWGDSNYIIQSSKSQSGGAWSTPANLFAVGATVYNPQVRLAVDSAGWVTAVWTRFDGTYFILQSSRSKKGGAWSTPVDITTPGSSVFNHQMTVDSTGLATAVWRRYSLDTNDFVQSSKSKSGGAWSTPLNLSADTDGSGGPQLTVDSSGLVTAVWMRGNGTNFIIQSRTSKRGAAWSARVDLSSLDSNAYDPQVTADSTGLATAVWTHNNGTNDIIQASWSQSGGAWSTPVDVSAVGRNASDPQVTVDSNLLVTAIWSRNNGSANIVQSSTVLNSAPTPSGSPTPTPTLSETGSNSEFLGLASLFAILAGAGLVTVARRKRSKIQTS